MMIFAFDVEVGYILTMLKFFKRNISMNAKKNVLLKIKYFFVVKAPSLFPLFH